MYVEYEDKRVKKLFDDLNDVRRSKNLMQKKIGAEMTRAVKKRYNQIVAHTSFAELFRSKVGKIESLSGNSGEYSLHITANYRLIVAPLTNDFSSKGLAKCDVLIIKGVVDYHGEGANNNWIIP